MVGLIRAAWSCPATLCTVAVGLVPLLGAVARPPASVAAGLDDGPALVAGARESGVQITPDGRRFLISKDVKGADATERWALTRNLDDETVTGNVFPADGGAPSFVFCTTVTRDADEASLECSVARSCLESPCTSHQWTSLGTIRVPVSFLEPPGPNVSELPDDDPLRVAPDAIVIDGRTIVLEVDELRRDYLTAGNPLMARIRPSTEDSSPFPSGVAIDRLWVINGRLAWQSSPVADPSTRPDPPPSAIEAYFTGGPQWGPTLSDPTSPLVTPVVRLRRGEETWLLRGSPTPIEITV